MKQRDNSRSKSRKKKKRREKEEEEERNDTKLRQGGWLSTRYLLATRGNVDRIAAGHGPVIDRSSCREEEEGGTISESIQFYDRLDCPDSTLCLTNARIYDHSAHTYCYSCKHGELFKRALRSGHWVNGDVSFKNLTAAI